MADKIPIWGNFNIPSEVFDIHEWVSDEFIDGDIGSTCTLVFPAKREACDNCLFDPHTNRSANIYRTGGPTEFNNHQICPRCQGNGFLEQPSTDTIRLRIYWEQSAWRDIGIKVADPTGLCMVIGYMVDLPKLEKANVVLLNDDIKDIRNYSCARDGEAKPWGFRGDRYFAQMMKRTGGG
jgi:hypothetical protein